MSIALLTRGYVASPVVEQGVRTLDKGPKIVKVKDLKPEIRASKERQ